MKKLFLFTLALACMACAETETPQKAETPPKTETPSEDDGQTIEENTSPSAPENLAVVETTYTGASLTWDAVPGATSYKVYYCLGKSFGSEIASMAEETSETNFTLTKLDPDTTYTYAVTAIRNKNSSPFSLVARATTHRLEPTSDLKVTATTPTSITLKWDKDPYAAAYYEVECRETNETLIAYEPTFTHTRLTTGTTYHYSVYTVLFEGQRSRSSARITAQPE